MTKLSNPEIPISRITRAPKIILGWREYVELPQMDISRIKVKIDTGARTSALHATNVKIVKIRGKLWVKFHVNYRQRDKGHIQKVKAELFDERMVKSSNGHASKRPVIITDVSIGGAVWPIEVTLVDRDLMGFRMLLGRQAIRGRCVVDPAKSFHLNKKKKKSSI